MSKFSKDNLFLLEFLIDKVNLDFCVAQKVRCMSGETCVSFQFLDNPPIPVCERDFVPKMKNYMEGCGGCGNIKNGKSCLFSLTQDKIPELKKKFPLKIEVFKKLKEDTDEKAFIGRTEIQLHFMFQDLMTTAITQDTTATKTIKDCYKLHNKDMVGHISAYVRLSCFGKEIINKFQMNMKDNTVDFKADEGHYLFKYNKKSPSETPKQPYLQGSPPNSFPQKTRPQTSNQQSYPPQNVCPPPEPTPPCGNPAPCTQYDPCGGTGKQELSCCQAKSKPYSAGCPCMVQDEAVQPDVAAKEKGKKGKGGKKKGKK